MSFRLYPCKEVADAIRNAIQAQFLGSYHCWTETPQDVRDRWWELFQKNLSFQPNLVYQVRRMFDMKCAKRLSDMLTKVRKKGTRPGWMGEEAYKGLLKYWDGETFKNLSTQNKTNRGSTKGGAVHTSGRKAHLEVALELSRKIGRDVYPDELFIKTHKRKTGVWVDKRAETTYDCYHQRLSEIQTQDGETSNDGAQKMYLWKDCAGGRSRGRVYGIADLSPNIRHGATSLTQQCQAPTCMNDLSLEAERTARLEAEQVAARAEERAINAENVAKEAQENMQNMQATMMQFNERMQALERQSEASGSTSRPSPHPHYDDALDDQSL